MTTIFNSLDRSEYENLLAKKTSGGLDVEERKVRLAEMVSERMWNIERDGDESRPLSNYLKFLSSNMKNFSPKVRKVLGEDVLRATVKFAMVTATTNSTYERAMHPDQLPSFVEALLVPNSNFLKHFTASLAKYRDTHTYDVLEEESRDSIFIYLQDFTFADFKSLCKKCKGGADDE